MGTLDDKTVTEVIALAMREDLGTGDVTTALMPSPDEPSTFQLLGKQRGVFCGYALGTRILHAYDPLIRLTWCDGVADGMPITDCPTTLGTLAGPLGSILSAERVFLNFLQRLSGVATATRAYVDAVSGTGARVFDTRKTTPGWRSLDKYAVRCGGGANHRTGLFDAVLIKDNHLAGVAPERLAGTIFEMLNRMHAVPIVPSFVEVEADTMAQAEALFAVTGIDVVLLDNFSCENLRRAVALRDALGLRGKVELEASGGITLETIRAVAETGVERISVGAITHGAGSLDLSLERREC